MLMCTSDPCDPKDSISHLYVTNDNAYEQAPGQHS